MTDTANPASSAEFVGDGGLESYGATPQPGLYDLEAWTPPTGFNPRDMSAEERAAIREAAGSHEANAMRDAYRKIYDARRAGSTPAAAAPAHPATAQHGNQSAEPGNELAAKLGNALGDQAGCNAMVEVLMGQADSAARRLDAPAEIENGWRQVERNIYRGSDAEQAEGMAAIASALEQIGGHQLVAEVEASGVLADPNLHMSLLNLARQITKRSAAR